MSGTQSANWTTDKIASVHAALETYGRAQAALTALGVSGATAQVTLIVTTGAGSQTFGFDMDVTETVQFFTPVVNAMASALQNQGVTLS